MATIIVFDNHAQWDIGQIERYEHGGIRWAYVHNGAWWLHINTDGRMYACVNRDIATARGVGFNLIYKEVEAESIEEYERNNQGAY